MYEITSFEVLPDSFSNKETHLPCECSCITLLSAIDISRTLLYITIASNIGIEALNMMWYFVSQVEVDYHIDCYYIDRAINRNLIIATENEYDVHKYKVLVYVWKSITYNVCNLLLKSAFNKLYLYIFPFQLHHIVLFALK